MAMSRLTGTKPFQSKHSHQRLEQLGVAPGSIATALRQMAFNAAADRVGPPLNDEMTISAATVKQVMRARELRGKYLDDKLFADPAWDMLLELFHAELEQYRLSVSSLCISSNVPATTALRHLKHLTDSGWTISRQDPMDSRRRYVELSARGSMAMRAYFSDPIFHVQR